MKNLILISVVILLSGCAEIIRNPLILANPNRVGELLNENTRPKAITSEIPVTYNWMGDGRGSYQQLQTDRYECAQEAAGYSENVSGSRSGSAASVSGTGGTRVNGSLFSACLGARNWQENNSGTGIGVASIVTTY